MPYIKAVDRPQFQQAVDNLISLVTVDGEVNYVISELIFGYLNKIGFNYTGINRVMGILNCVGAEFYRRVAGPYEDEKAKQNGDIYL